MTTSEAVQQTHANAFNEQIEIIRENLNLAIRWNRSTVLLVVSNSEYACTDAESALGNSLSEQGQKVVRIQLNALSTTWVTALLEKFQTAKGHVFFLRRSGSENLRIFTWLGHHKDILVRGRVRLVIWLTTAELVDLAYQAPDLWDFRQHVIELPEMPSQEYALQEAIESAWQEIGEYADPFEGAEEEIRVHESALSNLTEKEEPTSARAKSLLTLGILNWRKGNLEKSIELLEDAIKAAIRTEDNWFEAECFNAIALVKFAQGKSDEAVDAYKQAIKAAPDQIFVWNNLGNLCLKIMRNDEATYAFQKTLQHDPKDPIAWNGLGTVYYRIGYIDDAISAYRQAIENAPLLAQPWSGLGDAYVNLGRDADAIDAYQKAIGLNKGLVAPWLRIAEIYSRQGRNREAIKTYQHALVVNPKDHQIWNELGLVLLKINSFEEATRAFLKAIELDHSFGWAYSNLALAYSHRSMYLDAVETCKKSLQIFTDDNDKIVAWDRLANFYRAMNNYDKAMQAYQSADRLKKPAASPFSEVLPPTTLLESLPTLSTESLPVENREPPQVPPLKDEEDPSTEGAELNERINTPAWIFHHEEQSMEMSSSVSYPKELLSKVEMRNLPYPQMITTEKTKEEPMNTQEALKIPPTYQAVSSLGFSEESIPKDPFENTEEITESRDPEVWNKKGNIHFQNREYDQAISAYNKAIELNSAFGWPYVNLAYTYLNLGKYPEATLLYQKSASLLTKSEEKAAVWNNLGNIYRHLNEYENALAAYQTADELDPQNAGRRDNVEITSLRPNSHSAQVWLELGNLFFKSRSYNEAAKAYTNAVEIDPMSGWAQSNLAMSLVFLGKYQEAVSAYRKSIELFSSAKDKAVTWNRLGNIYRKMNDEDSARKAYQTAAVLSNEKPNLLTRTRFSLLGNCYAN